MVMTFEGGTREKVRAARLKKFDRLPREIQRAWLGFFAGAKRKVTYYEGRPEVIFGKHECQCVDFAAVWLVVFPRLGWLEIEPIERFRAIGMIGLPMATRYELTPTWQGRCVREAYWERLEERIGD